MNNEILKNTIDNTFFKLVELGGNKKCIIKRNIKLQNKIFSNKLTDSSLKIDHTSIDGTFLCFFIAQPITIIGSDELGSEYSNKLFIRISDVRNSKLFNILENDEIFIDISGEYKRYSIKSISHLFDVLYIILLK